MYWLFQATVGGSRAVRSAAWTRTRVYTGSVSRIEDHTNEMLYRREVEFARGHGIGVEWDLAEGRMDQAVVDPHGRHAARSGARKSNKREFRAWSRT